MSPITYPFIYNTNKLIYINYKKIIKKHYIIKKYCIQLNLEPFLLLPVKNVDFFLYIKIQISNLIYFFSLKKVICSKIMQFFFHSVFKKVYDDPKKYFEIKSTRLVKNVNEF